MDRSRIPKRINLFLSMLLLTSQIYVLFLFPFVNNVAPVIATLSLWAAVLMTLPTWYLIHEAIHEMFYPNKYFNDFIGKLLSVVCGVSFRGIRTAHLLHHRWNRIEEFSEVYNTEKTSWLDANLNYYFLLLGGLYWVELLGGLLICLPASVRTQMAARLAGQNNYMKRVYESLNRPQNAKQIHIESVLSAILFAFSFLFYGQHYGILLVVLSARAFLISFFDNSFHFDTDVNPGNNSEGTRNHSMPASWMILNFNFHKTHHKNPRIPWIELPAHAHLETKGCEGNYIFRALEQLRGPIPNHLVHHRHEKILSSVDS